MKRLSRKNEKHGFTLIEIMLALAIMIVMMTIVWGTFAIINTSHANVVVINDAKDYADLNMQAIRNVVANADDLEADNDPSVSGSSLPRGLYYKLSINDGILYYNDGSVESPAMDIPQFTVTDSTGTNVNKWYIKPQFVLDKTWVHVKLEVYDNATDQVYYTLEQTIHMPNLTKTVTGSGTCLKFNTKTFPS